MIVCSKTDNFKFETDNFLMIVCLGTDNFLLIVPELTIFYWLSAPKPTILNSELTIFFYWLSVPELTNFYWFVFSETDNFKLGTDNFSLIVCPATDNFLLIVCSKTWQLPNWLFVLELTAFKLNWLFQNRQSLKNSYGFNVNFSYGFNAIYPYLLMKIKTIFGNKF